MYAMTIFAVNAAFRPNRLLRAHLATRIRRLVVAISVPVSRSSEGRLGGWRAWTARLSKLPLLQELHVHVFFNDGLGENWAERMAMLQALKEVGARRVFVVTEYHWVSVRLLDVKAETLPFELRQAVLV
jgi:hypothetical protein